MKRSLVREYAFKLLYQNEIQNNDNLSAQIDCFLAEYPIPDDQYDFFETRVRGAANTKAFLDKIFEPYLNKWTLDRLPKIDLVILRLAIYEMKFCTDVPNNVAISEAVRLAKIYSGEESRSYINAILGNVERNVFQES